MGGIEIMEVAIISSPKRDDANSDILKTNIYMIC